MNTFKQPLTTNMSDIRSLARVNTGVEDALLFDSANNPFLPDRGWTALTNFTIDWLNTERPKIAQDQGGISTWTITKKHDHNGPVIAHFTITAPTKTGGTYIRLCDYAGFAAINEVRISYYANRLQTITRDDLYERMIKDHSRRDLVAINRLVGGNLSNAQREALAAGSQTFDVEIPVFWAESIKYWFPVVCLTSELTIEIVWENATNVIQTDGTAPTYTLVANQELHLIQSHLPNKDRSAVLTMSQANNGILYKYLEPNRFLARNTSPASPYDIDILQNRGAAQSAFVTVRKISECESTTFGNDYFNYLRVDSMKFNGNGVDIIPELTHDELVNIWFPRFFKGEVGRNYYVLSMNSLNPADRINNTGSLNFGYIANKRLTLYWSSTITPSNLPAVAIRVDFVTMENNVIQLRRGDLIKIFK